MKIEKWHAFSIWLAGTLAAIAWIGDALYASIAIAVGSGVVFGVLNWLAAQGQAAGDEHETG